MKTLALAVLLLPCAALADHHAGDIVPVESLKWQPREPGVQLAPLWGDMSKKGPFGVLIQFDKGLMHPPHWHDKDVKHVVVSGTMIFAREGEEHVLAKPGSYLVEKAGKKHVSGCSQEGPCRFVLVSEGPFARHVDGKDQAAGAKKK